MNLSAGSCFFLKRSTAVSLSLTGTLKLFMGFFMKYTNKHQFHELIMLALQDIWILLPKKLQQELGDV